MNLFDGPGEMRERCRTFDWASTPLGPVAQWPAELCTAVRLILATPVATSLWIGPSYTLIYNDGYKRILGVKHPLALGRSGAQVWDELWPTLERSFAQVRAGGAPVFEDEALLVLERLEGGKAEEAWFTYSLSALPDANGDCLAVYNLAVENTARVRAERSLALERTRLEAVFELAPTFLAVLRGREHRIELVNEAFRQTVGHRDFVGRTAAEAVPESVEQGFIALLDHVYDTGEPYVGREQPIMLQRTPGAPHEQSFLDFIYLPFDDAAGERIGVIAHGSDVTQQVMARREVERLLTVSDAARAEAERDRALLSDVLESMNDAHCMLDAEFRFTRINSAMEQAIGEPREMHIGRTQWEAFPASLGTRIELEYRRVARERSEAHFTHHYTGEGFDVVVELDVYSAEGGGLSVFWRDVSARYHGDQALADSEARFRAVQDASPSGSLLCAPVRDEHGELCDVEILYANPASERITGIPLGNLVGAQARKLLPSVMDVKNLTRIRRVAESGEPWRWEGWFTGDGLSLGIELVVVRTGDLLHVRFADVSERMRAAQEREELFHALESAYREAQAMEGRLRDLFEQAPVAVAVMSGPEHVYTIVSPRYTMSPGGGRPLLGRSVREAFPEIAGSGFLELMDRVYETGTPYFASERRVLLDDHGDGNLVEHYFNVGYQPLRNANGEVYAIASVAYDVTDQIRARQEVDAARETAEKARAEAEAANRAKSEFLAVMSHELRTPLNAIGGYAELIELGVHGPVTEPQRTALARIQVSQRHLLGLINGVLNYSRVEAGAVTYDLTRVPVAEAIAEAETLIAPQLRAKGLGYTWMGCAPKLAVLADRDKLQQILLNLLSNAVKFTNARDGLPGRIEVSCDVEESAAAERHGKPVSVRIHVKDTGVGVPPERLASIFEPFVQVDQRLTRKQEGVGLGLTISRDLARGMGGDLTAESTVGVGSVFTISLPLA